MDNDEFLRLGREEKIGWIKASLQYCSIFKNLEKHAGFSWLENTVSSGCLCRGVNVIGCRCSPESRWWQKGSCYLCGLLLFSESLLCARLVIVNAQNSPSVESVVDEETGSESLSSLYKVSCLGYGEAKIWLSQFALNWWVLFSYNAQYLLIRSA